MKALFLLLCCISFLARGDGLPDLGSISQAAISPQQERQLGEQSMFEIRADKSYLDDAEINDYLNQIGYRLAANSNDPGLGFEFFAIDDNAINAFSLPGGFIGVNTGLILTTQSESELASVLAHEISHATQHHIIRMIAGQKVDTLASLAAIAVAILAARSNPDAAQATILGAQAGSIQRQLNFTRLHEQEADRIGIATLQKAGFDVYAMPAFFERLQKATTLLEGDTPPYLLTHPLTTERIADMTNRAQQVPYRLVPDSLSYHLVRAKLQATQKSPQEAIAFFRDALGAQKYGNQTAQRYGLVLALLRNNQAAQAAQEFAPLQDQVTRNPMIATLAGKVRHANGDDKNLHDFYRTALQNFPQHRALAYDYADLLLQAGMYEKSLKLLKGEITDHPDDPNLYALEARTYAAMGKHQDEHHALARSYSLRGNLHGAIEQLELAKQSGGDYYQLSGIESELKKLKEMAAAHPKN
jgi:predicted Zn-dependent protease